MKIQNQTKNNLKSSENDEEENWGDIEFFGLKKKHMILGKDKKKRKINLI